MKKRVLFFVLLCILLVYAINNRDKWKKTALGVIPNIFLCVETISNSNDIQVQIPFENFEDEINMEKKEETKSHPYVTIRKQDVAPDGISYIFPEPFVENDWGEDSLSYAEDWMYADSIEHLETPEYLKVSFEDGVWEYEPRSLAGFVGLAVDRYCEENNIDEIFHFDFNNDIIISQIDHNAQTVRVESEQRVLYVDLDWFYYYAHVYEVEEQAGDEVSILLTNETGESIEETAIYDYIKYGLKKYCEKEGINTDTPFQLMENMSGSIMFKAEKEYVDKFDLAKEITPDISASLFNYYLKGPGILIYMQIDTYSMKIYIYDAKQCIVKKYHPIAIEPVVENDSGFVYQDCWISAEKIKNLSVPETLLYYDEVSGKYYLPQGMINLMAQALEQYCSLQGIEDEFSYRGEEDIVGAVDQRFLTVKVESKDKIIYIDLDCGSMHAHVYEMEEGFGNDAGIHLDDLTDGEKDNGTFPYLKYGLKKYCNQCDFAIGTEFCLLEVLSDTVMFENRVEPAIKIDLAKELTPEVESRLLNFYIEGSQGKFYMQIDTYSMKIFIYEAADCEMMDYGRGLI